MDDFLEIDEKKKTINSLNLDDFSIEDLIFGRKNLQKMNQTKVSNLCSILNKFEFSDSRYF